MPAFLRSKRFGLSRLCNSLSRAILGSTVLAMTILVAPLLAQTGNFVTIDAPGAGTLQNQGTTANVINQSGVIAGYYVDTVYDYHGFVRSAAGVITEFEAPGMTETMGLGINTGGEIVGKGFYQGSKAAQDQGFLRTAYGSFTSLHPQKSVYTYPTGVNDSGEIAGTYSTYGDVNTGFLATVSGGVVGYTVFQEPEASTQEGNGTFVSGVNASGEVFGDYIDATGMYHGFTRDASGNFTSFDAPGVGTGRNYGTIPLGMNNSGEIVGYYSDSNLVLHGFIRDAAGNITDFDPSGSTGTFAYSINDDGEVTGYYADSLQVDYGFLMDASGTITTFTVPVENIGTQVLDINNAEQMIGFYYDSSGGQHGFLWQAASAKAAR
jgi:hypothetical protein